MSNERFRKENHPPKEILFSSLEDYVQQTINESDRFCYGVGSILDHNNNETIESLMTRIAYSCEKCISSHYWRDQIRYFLHIELQKIQKEQDANFEIPLASNLWDAVDRFPVLYEQIEALQKDGISLDEIEKFMEVEPFLEYKNALYCIKSLQEQIQEKNNNHYEEGDYIRRAKEEDEDEDEIDFSTEDKWFEAQRLLEAKGDYMDTIIEYLNDIILEVLTDSGTFEKWNNEFGVDNFVLMFNQVYQALYEKKILHGYRRKIYDMVRTLRGMYESCQTLDVLQKKALKSLDDICNDGESAVDPSPFPKWEIIPYVPEKNLIDKKLLQSVLSRNKDLSALYSLSLDSMGEEVVLKRVASLKNITPLTLWNVLKGEKDYTLITEEGTFIPPSKSFDLPHGWSPEEDAEVEDDIEISKKECLFESWQNVEDSMNQKNINTFARDFRNVFHDLKEFGVVFEQFKDLGITLQSCIDFFHTPQVIQIIWELKKNHMETYLECIVESLQVLKEVYASKNRIFIEKIVDLENFFDGIDSQDL